MCYGYYPSFPPPTPYRCGWSSVRGVLPFWLIPLLLLISLPRMHFVEAVPFFRVAVPPWNGRSRTPPRFGAGPHPSIHYLLSGFAYCFHFIYSGRQSDGVHSESHHRGTQHTWRREGTSLRAAYLAEGTGFPPHPLQCLTLPTPAVTEGKPTPAFAKHQRFAHFMPCALCALRALCTHRAFLACNPGRPAHVAPPLHISRLGLILRKNRLFVVI